MVNIIDVTSIIGIYLARMFLAKGEKVRGVSSAKAGMADLTKKGFDGMYGDIADPGFLSASMNGVDTVFYMVPLPTEQNVCKNVFFETAQSLTKAVRDSKVQTLFFISILGADEKNKSGLLNCYGEVERILSSLHLENVIFVRPGYFMDHLLTKMPMVRMEHIIGDVIDPNTQLYLTDRKETAHTISSLYLKKQYYGRSKVELYNDKLSFQEATDIISKKIGVPDLRYVQYSDDQYRNYLVTKGVTSDFADLYIETAHAIGRGAMTPSHNDLATPNQSLRFIDWVENTFAPAYRSGNE
jgi:uncharacterized protein YbjT (DUF2867 family)